MGDQPRIFFVTTPTAHRCHQCCECKRQITKGERYQRVKGIWGTTWEAFVTCQECAERRDQLICDLDLRLDESIPFGALDEWYAESET